VTLDAPARASTAAAALVRDLPVWSLVAAAAATGVLLAPMARFSGKLSLAAAAAVGLFLISVARPVLGVYVLVVSTPLIIGIERGQYLPGMLRPNEMVLAVVVVATAAHLAVRFARGQRLGLPFGRVDAAILGLAVTSSVLPLLWMVARGLPPELDDYLHAATFWKYYALFLVVRFGIRSVAEVRSCLWLSMAAAAVAAVVGILQALQLFGVEAFVGRVYAPLGNESLTAIGRGTSTLGSSIAMGDVMTFHCVVAVSLLAFERRHRGVLAAAAFLFGLGAVASGQYTAIIALGVGVFAAGAVTNRFGHFSVTGIAGFGAASFLLRPVLERRLQGFESPEGMPSSWTARLENLQTFILPELTSSYRYLLGVRPSPRIVAPENWRDWVFIESGHLWLLWVGGVPLLLAFFWFLWAAVTDTARVARARVDAVGAAAVAAFAALVVIAVVSAFDAHLSTRGVAETVFLLLALAHVGRAAAPIGGTRPAGSLAPVGGAP
jgi:hypothetical protein